MPEKIFNLFLFITDELIHEIGAQEHKADGTDQAKIAYLQSQVQADYQGSRRFPVPEWCMAIRKNKPVRGWLTWQTWQALMPTGHHFHILEPIFKELGAVQSPLIVITPIVNGKPRIEGVVDVATGKPK